MFHVHFIFDLAGIAVLLLLAVGLLLGLWLALRKKWRVVAVLVLPLLFGAGWLVQHSLMVESRVWPVVLAAIDEARGAERVGRVRQLQQVWHFGEIRVLDWWRLSGQWQVCHRLWQQQGCHMPVGPFEAEGLARETLQQLSAGGT